ncbi:amidohydrolase family protein [Nocardioides humi]|uniref:Amidohydrolase family protein n=1 Tax=Nocardioides humi TaxID=449461 RepID=A0ABN2AE16_9ACTN|nr:amidohydrolase family protein [Nocardioides humi]
MTSGLIDTTAPVEQVAVEVVDCDIHVNPRNGTELADFMPVEWAHLKDLLYGRGMLGTSVIFAAPNEGRRLDAFGDDGSPAGSDPGLTGRQLFDEAGVDIAIIIPLTEKSSANPEHEAAMAATTNNWLAETWLSTHNGHGRYKGTIRVSSDPALAVAEIRKWADHPHFVQVMLNPYLGVGMGQRQFWPVYEAAIAADLTVCTHVTLQRPGPALMTSTGAPRTFLENHSQFSMLYAGHLVSMLESGVFNRFPDLRFTFVEGGYAWCLPLLWRLDNHWQRLRAEIPELKRPPSDYVRDHVSFTRQPYEEPRDPRYLARVIDWLGPKTLEFATDYPHWDGDYNRRVGFTGVDQDSIRRILGLNAIEKYRLPSTRAAAHWSEF